MFSRFRFVSMVTVLGMLVGLLGMTGVPQPVYSQGATQRAVPPFSVARPPEKQPDPIRLRSRQFAPEAGVEPGLADRILATPGKREGRAHVLLQLHGVPSQSELVALEAAGIKLLNYIPRNGWFASLPAQDVEGTLARVEVAGVVRWAGQILPEDKVDARVWAGEFGAWAMTEEGRVRLAVSFFDDVSLAAGRQVAGAHGAVVEGQSGLLNLLQIVASSDELASLASEDTVRWIDQVSPPYTTHNDDARRATRVNEVQALPYELYGTGVTVGIWDGAAVDASHDDFARPDSTSRVVPMTTTVTNHATHVGGTVAGSGARSAALESAEKPSTQSDEWGK